MKNGVAQKNGNHTGLAISGGEQTDMVNAGLPPWMQKMRKAAQEAVTADDVTAMVKAQVELAKKGDAKALDFIFNNVLGGSQLKGATFVQNNYQDGSRPDLPTPARPGTDQKLGVMARRLSAGEPLTRNDDGPPVDLT